jgi:hypothetical protein
MVLDSNFNVQLTGIVTFILLEPIVFLIVWALIVQLPQELHRVFQDVSALILNELHQGHISLLLRFTPDNIFIIEKSLPNTFLCTYPVHSDIIFLELYSKVFLSILLDVKLHQYNDKSLASLLMKLVFAINLVA